MLPMHEQSAEGGAQRGEKMSNRVETRSDVIEGTVRAGEGRRVMLRNLMAYALAPILRVTGFRFSKAYRMGFTRWHRIVYSCVSTIGANYLADGEGWYLRRP
jgi:hypothetical protein